MQDYPFKQFPSNEKIIINATYMIFGIGEVNTKNGLVDVFVL